MSKTLQTFLTLLRKSHVSRDEVLNFITQNQDPNFSSMRELINTIKEDTIPTGIVDNLIELVDFLIQSETRLKESEAISNIVNKSYTRYSEVITSTSVDDVDFKTISDYDINIDNQDLDYRVFHCPEPEPEIYVNNLLFKIKPVDKIPYNFGGQVKFVSYKYNVTVSFAFPQHITLLTAYGNIGIYHFLRLIGMAFIDVKDKTQFHEKVKNDNVIEIELNTFPFLKSLTSCYNSYVTKDIGDNTSLSNIKYIETCQIDTNGLILVPRLFYLSSFYIDGDIFSKEFVYGETVIPPLRRQAYGNDNQGPGFNLNYYKFNINGRNISDSQMTIITDRMVEMMNKASEEIDGLTGIKFERYLAEIKTRNGPKNIYGLKFKNYDIRSGLSQALASEERVVFYMKKLCQKGNLELSIYGSSHGLNPASDKYKAYFNGTNIVSIYEKNNTIPFEISLERSVIIHNPSVERAIVERNNLKLSGVKYLEHLIVNREKLHYSDFIPTSVIPMGQKEGINMFTFVLFGFNSYQAFSTGSDKVQSSSYSNKPLRIFASNFSFTPVDVKRVIRLYKGYNKNPNVIQVVVKSESYPSFIGTKPLLIEEFQKDHYLCMFKAGSDIQPATDFTYTPASDFVKSYITEETEEMITVKVNLGYSEPQISKRAILRYQIESFSIESEFNTLLSNVVSNLFGDSKNIVSFSVFIEAFAKHTDICNFFNLFKVALDKKVVDDNVISSIFAILEIPEIPSIRNFVNSISVPINKHDYPVFTREMASNVNNFFNEKYQEMEKVVRRAVSGIHDVSYDKIIFLFSAYNGFPRYVLDLISEDLISVNLDKISGEMINSSTMKILNSINQFNNSSLIEFYVDSKIDKDLILKASNELYSEIFLEFVNQINMEFTNEDYDQQLTHFFRSTFESEFEVTTIDSLNYKVRFLKPLKDEVMKLNGTLIEDIDYNIFIDDSDSKYSEFNTQVYNHNVHAMFEMKVDGSNIDVGKIAQTLANNNIYYNNLEGEFFSMDVSMVSIHELTDISIKFIIPYTHNGARLMVNKVRWEEDNYTFKLLTKTVEVEILLERTVKPLVDEDDEPEYDDIIFLTPKIDEIGGKDPYDVAIEDKEKSFNLLDKVKLYLVTEILQHQDLTSLTLKQVNDMIISSALAFCKRDKSDVREHARSFFSLSSALPEDFESKTYDNSNPYTKTISGFDSVTFFIYPISPTICKMNLEKNIQHVDYMHLLMSAKFRTKMVKAYNSMDPSSRDESLKKKYNTKNFDNAYEGFKKKFSAELEDKFKSSGNKRQTTLITKTADGINTISFGSLEDEATLAKGSSRYKIIKSKDPEFKELTNIDMELMDKEFKNESKKINKSNMTHNLSLLLSTIHWNSKQGKKYNLISTEKPKWIRFSDDSRFMAIAFYSGVKMYIASGNQYVFCSNLNHINVEHIIFGTNNLCITTQYQDDKIPFSKLWACASGFEIQLPKPYKLDFYKLSDGDVANVQLDNKEKKNVTVRVDYDGVKYNNTLVKFATTTFDHNKYYFSPNDEYLLWNRAGSFSIFSFNKLAPVRFQTYNGKPIEKIRAGTSYEEDKIPVKPIQTGCWTNDCTFVGTSYLVTNPLVKTKVTIDVKAGTISEEKVIPKFSKNNVFSSLVVDSGVKVHPLYTYLVQFRDTHLNPQTHKIASLGIWVYDVYISLVKKSDGIYLQFTNINGMGSEFKTKFEKMPERITDFLIDLPFDYYYDDKSIKKIFFYKNEVYNASKCTKVDRMVYYTDENFFAFQGDSIYIWSYKKDEDKIRTELSHLNANGYEKIIFEDQYLAILISSIPQAGIIQINHGLITAAINLNEEINFNRELIDVSNIVKEQQVSYIVKYNVKTDISFEDYTNPKVISNIFDSYPISSSMCLNRFPKYTNTDHEKANSEGYFSHGNLLLSVDNNVLTIIPKSVQKANLDGINLEWYNSHSQDNEEYWEEKRDVILNYFKKIEQVIPQAMERRDGLALDSIVKRYFRLYGGKLNFQKAIDEMVNQNSSIAELVPYFQKIFDVMGSSTFIYDHPALIKAVSDYWEHSTGPFFDYMQRNEFSNNQHGAYNDAIFAFKHVAGDNFISYDVGLSFKLLNQAFLDGKSIKSLLASKKTNKIMREILSIPLENVALIHLPNFVQFKNRINLMKSNLKRIEQMLEKDNFYKRYRFVSKKITQKKFKKALDDYLSVGFKSFDDQADTDFFISMNSKIEVISKNLVKLQSGVTYPKDFYIRDFKELLLKEMLALEYSKLDELSRNEISKVKGETKITTSNLEKTLIKIEKKYIEKKNERFSKFKNLPLKNAYTFNFDDNINLKVVREEIQRDLSFEDFNVEEEISLSENQLLMEIENVKMKIQHQWDNYKETKMKIDLYSFYEKKELKDYLRERIDSYNFEEILSKNSPDKISNLSNKILTLIATVNHDYQSEKVQLTEEQMDRVLDPAKILYVSESEVDFGKKMYRLIDSYVYANIYTYDTNENAKKCQVENLDSFRLDLLKNFSTSFYDIVEDEKEEEKKRNEKAKSKKDHDVIENEEAGRKNKPKVKSVYDVIYTFIKRKILTGSSKTINSEDILISIGAKPFNESQREKYEPRVKKFYEYIDTEFNDMINFFEIYGLKDLCISLGMKSAIVNNFVKVLNEIKHIHEDFETLSEFKEVMSSYINSRFVETIYNKSNSGVKDYKKSDEYDYPDTYLSFDVEDEADISTINAVLSEYKPYEVFDSFEYYKIFETHNQIDFNEIDEDFKVFNVAYVKEKYERLKEKIVKGNYVTTKEYNKRPRDINKTLVPLLWKYRHGVFDSKIPVLNIKITFDQPIEIEATSDKEKFPFFIRYKIDEEAKRRDNIKDDYGNIKINLSEIIECFDDLYKSSTISDQKYEHHNMTMFGYLSYEKKTVSPGLEFTKYIYNPDNTTSVEFVNVPMIYENESNRSGVMIYDEIKQNMCLTPFRSYDFNPKMVQISTNGEFNPLVFNDVNNMSYVVWYGNTKIRDSNKAFIVLQRLTDRKTSTYLYYKTKVDVTGKTNILEDETYVESIRGISKNQIEIKERIYVKVNEGGIMKNKEKFVTRTEFLSNMINEWILAEDMTAEDMERAEITSYMIKSRNETTIHVSNYKSGKYVGSIVEVYNSQNRRIVYWIFQSLIIKEFDFNSKQLYLVGYNYAAKGVHVRIGVMDIENLQMTPDPLNIITFDKEFFISKSYTEKMDNITCSVKDTAYITYSDGNNSYLLIDNLYNKHEKIFDHSKTGPIASVKSSLKNGYVALYFKSINRSEIWNSNGILYSTVEGECNWL